MSSQHITVFDQDRLYPAGDEALDVIAPENTRRFWRHRGVGPAFIKFSPGNRGRVAYLGRDLNDFLEQRRVVAA